MDDNEILFYNNKAIIYYAINSLKFVPERAEMEDLQQIGSMALWKAIETYDEELCCSFFTHCYNVIRCDLINWLEKLQCKKRQDVYIEYDSTYSDNFENDVIGDMLTDEIRKHISSVEAEIFLDKHIGKLTNKEIANKYNISLSTVKRKLDRAKDVLKNNLEWR